MSWEETPNDNQYGKSKRQILKYPINPTFHFSVGKFCEELAKFIFVEHLSFSFDEKIDFID